MAARGYGAPLTTIVCKDCGATVHVGEGERTSTCAFCGSSQVLAEGAGEPPIRPGGLLPFRVAKDEANKRFGAWLGALWFRPSDLKKIAQVSEMGGVYVPFWTFDADVSSRWSAERGRYYYETERYTETVNGQSVERTRQVQQTRWEPASGCGTITSTTCSSPPDARSPRRSSASSRRSTRRRWCRTSRSSWPDGARSSTR